MPTFMLERFAATTAGKLELESQTAGDELARRL